MISLLPLRLLAFLAALAVALTVARPAAAETVAWTDTASHENVPVQACDGIDLVTSYTVTRQYLTVNSAPHHTIWEEQQVQFAGSLSNDATGLRLTYGGQYTRIADLDAGTVVVRGLWLRVLPPDNHPIDVTITRYDGGMSDAPPAVLLAAGPAVVTTRLCELLGSDPAVAPADVNI
jgi:hypothetical protein